MIRRYATAFDTARVDQRPQSVTFGGNWLAIGEKRAHERGCVFVDSQQIRIYRAVEQNERVVVRGVSLLGELAPRKFSTAFFNDLG